MKLFIYIFYLVILLISIPQISIAKEVSSSIDYLEKGLDYYNHGNFEQAIISGLEAVKLSKEDRDINNQIESLIKLSRSYQSLGQYNEALACLEDALPLTEASEDKTSILCIMGSIYTSIAQFTKAEDLLQKGLDLAKNVQGENSLTSRLLNNLGNLRTAQDNYAEAITNYNSSISLAKSTGNVQLLARVQANCAKAHLLNNGYKMAIELLNSSLKKHLELNNSHNKAFGLVNLGQSYVNISKENPDYKTECGLFAYDAFSNAILASEEIGDLRTASYALGHLGRLYESEKRYEEALQLTRRALFAAQQVDLLESLYLWQWQCGRLFKTQGKDDDAITSYKNAVHTLQSIRQSVSDGGCANCNKTLFPESAHPVYFDLADLLLRKASTIENEGKEGATAYLIEARETIELLKSAELRDYFQDPCVDAYQAKSTSLDDISMDVSVIYVISLPERLELLVTFPTGIERFTVNVGSEEFAQETGLFRKMLVKRTTRQYMYQALNLYDWLIRPLEKKLALHKIETLIIVPDKALRSVPMAALHDGNQFLVNKYSIATTQGLSMTDPQPIEREGLDVLLAGLTESVQGFPPLPNVKEEMESIHDLYGGSLLMNQQFISINMKHELEETHFSVVHIASHGEFSGNADDTFVLTWDEKLNMDDLSNLIKTIRFRKKPIELLTLSACQTASGDDRAALGLAGVAIKAGARSALATLWYINDEASSKLVIEFYTQLKDKSISKAIALKRAQEKLLKDRRYRHPCYWSPFILIGNWL